VCTGYIVMTLPSILFLKLSYAVPSRQTGDLLKEKVVKVKTGIEILAV